MNNNLIEENELIDSSHNCIINVINHFYSINEFIWVLECLSQKHGCGTEWAGITFWDDLDEYDKSFYENKFDGVELYYFSDEEIFTLEEFYFYIQLRANKIIENSKDENEKHYICEMLEKIKCFFEL